MEETHPCVLYRGWCGGGRFAEARRTRGTKGQNRGGSLGWWPSNWGHRSTKRFPGGTGRGPGVRASTSETSSPKMVCRGAPGPPLPASLGGGRTSPLRASLAVHAGSGAHAGAVSSPRGRVMWREGHGHSGSPRAGGGSLRKLRGSRPSQRLAGLPTWTGLGRDAASVRRLAGPPRPASTDAEVSCTARLRAACTKATFPAACRRRQTRSPSPGSGPAGRSHARHRATGPSW